MKLGSSDILVCVVLALILSLFWGWIASLVHYEIGVGIGILIFWLSLKMLLNNVKRPMRTYYD